MNVSAIDNAATQYSPNFGHAVRVSISVRRPNSPIYDFISPAGNATLYKKLNSRIVGWLNSDLITAMRTKLERKRKVEKKLSSVESAIQRRLIEDFTTLDSDYKKLKMARSVYNRFHLGFIATGCDVPIIENLAGTAEIGHIRKSFGGQRPPIINEICKRFNNSVMKYIQHPVNRLKENGKELMLNLNFSITGVDKKGQNMYELESYEFKRIAKPLPYDSDDLCHNLYYLKQNDAFKEEIATSIQHIKNRILGKTK